MSATIKDIARETGLALATISKYINGGTFNQGSNGAGNVGGKGNPINPDGYDTAYLWENVLCKDRLLEILHILL